MEQLTQQQIDKLDQLLWLAIIGMAKAERDEAMKIWDRTFEGEVENEND